MEEEPDKEEQRLRSMVELWDGVEEWEEIERGQKEDKVMEIFKRRINNI